MRLTPLYRQAVLSFLQTVADVCLDNPFGPTCADSDYNNARKELAKTCAIQAVTGAVTSACDTIITEALPCFINPFDTVCDSNPAVKTYVAQLRSTRVAFCNSNLRIASLCTGAPVAKSVCQFDPFDTVCLGDNDYAGDRLSACRDGSATTGQCSNIIAKVCGNDPFDTLCGSGYNDDRANFCRNSVEPLYRCLKVEDRVCATNPLDSLCSASIYAGARINACRNDQSNPSCRTIIANLCHRDNNPFDSLCGSNYNEIRESVCASNPNSSRCSDTLTRVCGGNPFDSLCRNTQSYLDARVSICRGNPADGRCGWTIGSICRDDPFDSLCGGGYTNARETACRNGSNNTQCGNIVAGVCGNNPFDALCGNGYTGERETACRNGSTNTQCGNIVAGVCGDNPFDPLCGNGYTGERETACRNGSTNTQCGNIVAGVCGDNPFDALCGNGYTGERETACRNGSTNTQCGNVIAGVCGNNPFDTLCGSGYTLDRRTLCSDDPFTPRCAGNVYNDLRVTFCENNAGTHPSCPAPEPTITEVATPQVTAEVWADSFDEPLSDKVRRDDTESKFLIGEATDLDRDGILPYTPYHRNYNNGLNLADATFNGVALGGDATDGVAFFSMGLAHLGHWNSYTGILSGTNLGAPLTDTIGSAKWVGSFKYESFSPVDFVLNVSFDTGELDALITYISGIPDQDFYVDGGFDAAGVITGTTRRGNFRTNDPANRGTTSATGILTGLIGEEGAVGAFLMEGSFGGFVARPSSVEELQTVEQTCTDDPFHRLCAIGYESQRNAVIEHCITGDNANDESCNSANERHPCMNDPFQGNCPDYLPDHFEQARNNREAFCRTAGNADNALCTVYYTFFHICTKYPFDAQCLGNDRFTPFRRDACLGNPFATRCAGDGYNDLRVTFCENNADNPACPQPPQVTATVWADSFDTPLAHAASTDDRGPKFLIGRETDLDTGGVSSAYPYEPDYNKGLNLADATFNGVALGGDAADGVAFFAAGRTSNGRYSTHSYAGILEGTNLGAPLTDTAGSAKWVGSLRYEDADPIDFVLNISFGTGDGVGEVEALVLGYYSSLYGYGIYRLDGYGDYHLKGEFDDAGVITGTARRGFYRTNDPDE